ncbi:hypothetical protein STEG23_031661 [Scotinomys teguina]
MLYMMFYHQLPNDGRSLGRCGYVSLQIKSTALSMARKTGQWEKEEVAQNHEEEERHQPAMKRCRVTDDMCSFDDAGKCPALSLLPNIDLKDHNRSYQLFENLYIMELNIDSL